MSKITQRKCFTSTQLWATLALCLLLPACTSIEIDTAVAVAEDDSENIAPPSFTRGLIARDIPEPLYPLHARNQGIEGWVMLSFTVNENGEVMDNSIELIEEEPRGYFDISASNAARRLRFDNTRGEAIEDVRYVFRYELEELDLNRAVSTATEMTFRELIPRRFITPDYPPDALQQRVEGFVVVRFVVTTEGVVRNVVIDESNPPGVFDAAALVAASKLNFEPRLIFGAPVTVENVQFRFDWRLPRQPAN